MNRFWVSLILGSIQAVLTTVVSHPDSPVFKPGKGKKTVEKEVVSD